MVAPDLWTLSWVALVVTVVAQVMAETIGMALLPEDAARELAEEATYRWGWGLQSTCCQWSFNLTPVT